MTAKKGSLWKTSWNRGRGSAPPNILGQMAFFQNFTSGSDIAQYRTSVNSTLGLTLPFWFASVGINPSAQQAASPAFQTSPSSDLDIVSISADALLTGSGLSLDVVGDQFVSAGLSVVTALDSTFVVRTHFLDQMMGSATGTGPYSPNAGLLHLTSALLPGGFHGFCGGPGAPTLAKIHAWFKALKSNLAIQPIAGMTSHLYSAKQAYPTVPATLLNLGTDATQNMSLVTVSGTPAPQNNLLDVRFAY